MTNLLKRFALVICLLAMCVGLMGVAAFAAYDPVTATVPVNIALSGTLPETPDVFQIQVTAEDPAFPMPEGSVGGVYTMDMAGASSSAFEITYDKHGIYTYTVEQLPLGNEDCYQDTHTYKVIAQVINNEDYTGFDLIVVVYRDDLEEKWDEIYFDNRYANPGFVQIVATKTMDGKTPKDGAFTFELVDASGAVVETKANDANGDIYFTSMICNKIGTTTYTSREVAGKNNSIIYDKNEYTVVVDVAKNEDGDYFGTTTYKLGNDALEFCPNFANKTKPIVPQTGDNANLALWSGIMVVALAAIVVLLITMKKKSAKA